MSRNLRIAIIGSGITGLSCAAALKTEGLSPIVFDKGRGVGGRMATRRTPAGFQFDHGAQYVRAKSEAFRAMLLAAQASGAVSLWQDGSGQERFVGNTGMTGLAKYLCRGIAVHQHRELRRIERTSDGWSLGFDGTSEIADRLVITAPAAQSSALLRAEDPDLAAKLEKVEFDPCLTLMVGLNAAPAAKFASRHVGDGLFGWIARDTSKPGRPEFESWVAQAGPQWSAQNIERSHDEIARMMLPPFLELVGADPDSVSHLASHRWRYARVTNPLNQPFVADDTSTLFAGGDWCLGPRVEAAWSSGQAIAAAILQTLPTKA